MNAKEFYNTVKAMREAQKNYFKFRTKQFLEESKALERTIDAEIKRVDKIEIDKQQPRLNL
jgi:hypothetical protein